MLHDKSQFILHHLFLINIAEVMESSIWEK